MGLGFSTATHQWPVFRPQDALCNLRLHSDLGKDLWLIAGLGNPGLKYAKNRHNVGFMALDHLSKTFCTQLTRTKHQALYTKCQIGEHNVLLVKPMSYMNESGGPINKLASYYKIPPTRILILYDDMDIPLADVRLRHKGSHGGHNGMRNIQKYIKGDIPRIRIGIDRPKDKSVLKHVLEDFSKDEFDKVEGALVETTKIVKAVLKVGVERAISGVRV